MEKYTLPRVVVCNQVMPAAIQLAIMYGEQMFREVQDALVQNWHHEKEHTTQKAIIDVRPIEPEDGSKVNHHLCIHAILGKNIVALVGLYIYPPETIPDEVLDLMNDQQSNSFKLLSSTPSLVKLLVQDLDASSPDEIELKF